MNVAVTRPRGATQVSPAGEIDNVGVINSSPLVTLYLAAMRCTGGDEREIGSVSGNGQLVCYLRAPGCLPPHPSPTRANGRVEEAEE